MISFGFGWNDEVVRRPDGTLIRRMALVEGIGTTDGAARTLEGSYALSESPVLEELAGLGRGLANPVEVRSKTPAGHGFTAFPVDLDGLGVSSTGTLLDLVEGPNIDPNTLREGAERAREPDPFRHNPMLDISSNKVNPLYPTSLLDPSSKRGGHMAGWLYRDRFRALVDEWLALHEGSTKESLAKLAGVAPSTLITHYSGDREPGKKTLGKICKFFKKPLNFLSDDPEKEIPGVSLKVSRNISPAKRLILDSVAQKIGPDAVTDEKAIKVWRAIQELIDDGDLPPQK